MGSITAAGVLTYLAVDLLSEGGQSLSYKLQLVQVQGMQSLHLHAQSNFRPTANPASSVLRHYLPARTPDRPICCHLWTAEWSSKMPTMQAEGPHLV